ncbi:hypothetical protein FD04_GL000359 [Secundilactobacillus odoratitofui DSM 19909 = JCM 15043]|uniref:Transglycosylase associated protein n=1 Tax=Secundilactobacillus odoratitofui DSM 19909 = JCM 15043 TaxID=1423776 RepID=A0A0R1M032_9LACO|nr:hypothetical protein [Secundilactobacillus odoratitofui]KRK98625.1 hypothetical protein FD04_GL000359 [Secundilactobacillus odoratitofui DSM 19909 = JCM 15043]
MIVYIEVIIGVVVGLVTSWLLNIVKRPSNRVWQRRTEVLGIAMGVLGAISATQFVSYGPQFVGCSVIPAAVGGIVLTIVVLFTGKSWFSI